MAGMTILEGSTFCICDEIGDLDGRTSGFFAEDTRFLSRLELRINGERPLLLSSGKIEYFSAAFYLRNPVARGLPAGHALDRARRASSARGCRIISCCGTRAESRSASSSRSTSAPTSPTSSRSRSTTSRSATRCTHVRSPPRPASATTAAPTSSCSRSRTAAARRRRCCSRGPVRSTAPGSSSSSSSRRVRAGTCASTSFPRSRARSRRRSQSSGASARGARTCRPRSTPGTCRCRGSGPRTTALRARSPSRSPTWPRCGCGRTTGSECSLLRVCPGS